jgi:hypothetical protein
MPAERADLLGAPLTPSEERLLAVYEELKALAVDPELAPGARANVRAALAVHAQAVNSLALVHEHLADLGV